MINISFNTYYSEDNSNNSGNKKAVSNEKPTTQQSLFLKDLTTNLKNRQAKEEITSLFARFNNNNDDCIDSRDGKKALEKFQKIYAKYLAQDKPNIDTQSLENTANENIFYDKDTDVYLQKIKGTYKPLFEVTDVVDKKINKTIQNGKINFTREYSTHFSTNFVNLKENENQEYINQYRENFLKNCKPTKENDIYENKNTGEFYSFNEQTLQIEKIKNARIDENGNIYRIEDGKYIINGQENPDMTDEKYSEIFPKEFMIATFDTDGIRKGDKIYEKNGFINSNGKKIDASREELLKLNEKLQFDEKENLYYKETENSRQYKIYNEETKTYTDIDLNSIQANNLNGKIEDFSQDGIGDCYLLSAINLLKSTNPEALDKVLEPIKDENGNLKSMKVHFHYENKKGKIHPYDLEFTKEEILQKIKDDPDLSDGDMDINVIEMAYEKFRSEIANNKDKYSKELYINATGVATGERYRILDGGTTQEAIMILTGKKIQTHHYMGEKAPNSNKKIEELKNTIKELLKINKAIGVGYYQDYENKADGHGVVITQIDDQYIYVQDSNPTKGKGHTSAIKQYPISEFIARIHTITTLNK